MINWLFVESASQIGGISIGTGVEQQRKVEAGTDINIILCSHLMCQLIRMRQAHPAIIILMCSSIGLVNRVFLTFFFTCNLVSDR